MSHLTELEAARSALSSAQRDAAEANAFLHSTQQQHSAQTSQLEADLRHAQEQQQAQSQLATDEQIREQVTARLTGEACLPAII